MADPPKKPPLPDLSETEPTIGDESIAGVRRTADWSDMAAAPSPRGKTADWTPLADGVKQTADWTNLQGAPPPAPAQRTADWTELQATEARSKTADWSDMGARPKPAPSLQTADWTHPDSAPQPADVDPNVVATRPFLGDPNATHQQDGPPDDEPAWKKLLE